MASPVTQRILNLRRIKVLHLEPTDVCQAACPMCARETDPAFNKKQQHHLTISHIQKHFSNRVIAGLDKVFMCGTYGDPAAAKHTLDIYRWFRKLNPDITLGMNTNGAIQNTFWWHELGRMFNQPEDYVVFSIDGLADTNATYRRGVDWNKLMANADAYISAGGSAHWDMLVYRHNQHQVDECEQLARRMGFSWFRAKVSNRGFTDALQSPLSWQSPVTGTGAIQCHVLAEKSAYIDARGRLSPCCWIGGSQFDVIQDIKQVQVTWKTSTPNTICQKACGTHDSKTNFDNQWRREIQLQ
jgi:sulfatase maturation enzyme AslB (radical SAM superfamily)